MTSEELKAAAVRQLYSLGTWNSELQAYTPQDGLNAPSINVTIHQLRRALRELRAFGYAAYRVGNENGKRDSDPNVLVERTDGDSIETILERWKR